MPVTYGKTYIQQPIGIFKLTEVLLCIAVILFLHRHAAAIVGLLLSLIILILSCTSLAHEVDIALRLQYLPLIAIGIWMTLSSALSIRRKQRAVIIMGSIAGILTGSLYIADGVVSLKEYEIGVV